MVNFRRDSVAAAGVFLCSAALLWWLAGTRLVWIDDEGIYLEGARRMMAGDAPYRDFFALTGPGVYWNLAASFKLFGVSLGAARLVLIAGLATIAACLFWLCAKLHSRGLGLWLAWFYVVVLAANAGGLVVNHRWDSAALTMLGAALLVHAVTSGRSWPLIAAGAAAAYAAWVTPPVLLVAAALLAWAAVERRWQGVLLFCAGGAIVSAAAVAILAATGSLVPMIEHLLWTTSQYAGPNRFAYGAIVGGYRNLFADAAGLDLVIRAYLVMYLVLPAVVPVVAVAGMIAARRLWNRRMLMLLLCAVAAVLSSAPRMDVGHLTYSAPLSYAAAGCALAALLPARGRFAVIVFLSLGACAMCWVSIHQRTGLDSYPSRAGRLVGVRSEVALLRALNQSVRPGEGFFAFPYIPIAYFLTQGENPSRYSYLQPGMMSDADEAAVLAALQWRPPVRILYMDLSPAAFLRLFPSSDPSRLRMRRIESWLSRNYEPSESFSRAHPGYSLLVQRRNQQPAEPVNPGRVK
jgi:hypothetical protein